MNPYRLPSRDHVTEGPRDAEVHTGQCVGGGVKALSL